MKFSVNKRVEVKWGEEFYRSIVQEYGSSNFTISIPSNGGKYLPISVGETVEIHYYDGDMIYRFDGEIVRRENKGIPVLVIKKPTQVKKIQRRRYVRVPVATKLKYVEITPDFTIRRIDSTLVRNMKEAITIDISGGGIKFITNEDLKNKTMLVMLQLDNMQIIAKGEMVRCFYDEINNIYDCGINYTEIGEQDREKLISYIFKTMREQIRKA